MNTVKKLFPLEASALRPSTGSDVFVYMSKETNSEFNVEQGKFYYIDEEGNHRLFSIGSNSASSLAEILWTSVDGVTINATTASAFGDGVGSKTIDPSVIKKHSVYKIEIQAFLNIEEVPENIVVKLKLGSTELVSDTFIAINFPGLTDEPFKATYYIGINAVGSSGSVIASSEYHTSVYSLNISGTVTGGSPTPVSIDLSTNQSIDVEVNAGTGCVWKTAISEIQKLN